MKKHTMAFIIASAAAAAGCSQSDNIGVAQCSSRFDCNSGERCNDATQTCEAIPESACSGNSDCKAGEICDAVSQECIVAVELCSSNDDCSVGLQCDSATGKCVDIPQTSCKEDGDCGANQTCDKNTNRCIAVEPIPDACANGVIDAGETDIDCGGTCGACINGKACQKDADCASDVCIANICTTSECINASANDIEISEVFTNPIDGKAMEHTASKQQKFIELHNTTSSQIRLDNLKFSVAGGEIALSGCIAPQIYLVIHPAGTPLEALTITGRAAESDSLAELVASNGNFAMELALDGTRIHAVSVPDMTGKDGVSAALPPKDDRKTDDQGRDILVPHDSIDADEDGDHPYSPGLHNQAVIPQG